MRSIAVVERERRGLRGPRPALAELLGEHVAEQHDALGMAVREHGELAQRLAGIQLLGPEALVEVGEHVVEREPAERERVGLTEQRALADVEELAHHRRLGARVDVGGRVVVVLDPRAQQAVEVLASDEQVLELVEDHQRRRLVALPQRLRQVEQPVDDRLRRLGVRRVGARPDHDVRAAGPDAEPEPGEQAGEMGADPAAVQRRVGGCDPARDVGHVGDAREVHVRGAPPGLPQLRRVGQEQARLAVAPWGCQPHAHAVARAPPQGRQLRLAVDQQIRRHWALEAKRRALSHSCQAIPD